MQKILSKLKISYSRILSLPVAGEVIYLFQIYLLEHEMIKNIFVSLKPSKYQDELIKRMKNMDSLIVVTSIKLFSLIKIIPRQKLIFDTSTLELSSLTTVELYDLMWTLLFCGSVSRFVKLKLQKIISKNYPVCQN